jgi:hypothetical protein
MGHLLLNLRMAASISLFAVLASGCGKVGSESAKQTTNTEITPVTATVPQPGKDEKNCFNCAGQGTVACRAAGCVAGKVDCPGACIKLNRGNWVQMAVAGHDPNEWWIKFPNASGQGGYQAWTRAHVGEAIVYQNGEAVNIGPCKICGGTTRVPCSVCKGAGKVTCEICKGKKFVPQSWTATDNPWLNSQPDLIRFTDGRVILGKIVLTSGNDRTIKTREGKILHVNASEIAPKVETNPSTGTKL